MSIAHEIAQRMRSLFGRAVVHSVDDSGPGQRVTVEGRAGHVRSDVPVHQQFGLSSRAPIDGAVTHVFASGGDEADLVALPLANPSLAHLGGLAEGETVLYDAVGQAVYLEGGKFVRIQAVQEMKVEIGGNVILDLTATLATLSVDLQVNGKITATGDVVGDGISLHDHRHAQVKTGTDTSGPPQAS